MEPMVRGSCFGWEFPSESSQEGPSRPLPCEARWRSWASRGEKLAAAPSLGVRASCPASRPAQGPKSPRGASERAAWGRAGPGEAARLPRWGQIPPAGQRGAGGDGEGLSLCLLCHHSVKSPLLGPRGKSDRKWVYFLALWGNSFGLSRQAIVRYLGFLFQSYSTGNDVH